MHVEDWIASERQVGVDRAKEARPLFTCKNTNTGATGYLLVLLLSLMVQTCHPSYSNILTTHWPLKQPIFCLLASVIITLD